MPRKLNPGDRFVKNKWQYYAFWVFFAVWIILVVGGFLSTANMPFRSTYTLPSSKSTCPSLDISRVAKRNDTKSAAVDPQVYGCGLYTEKYTFLWGISLIITIPRVILAAAVYAYLSSSRKKRLNLSIFGIAFILYGILELLNIIAHVLEWQKSNLMPDALSDTNYQKNVANSWYYCCEYGNHTQHCDNYRGSNSSIPCFNWTPGTELTVNPDFGFSALVSIMSFICAFMMAIFGYSGRSDLLAVFETQSGDQVLVRME